MRALTLLSLMLPVLLMSPADARGRSSRRRKMDWSTADVVKKEVTEEGEEEAKEEDREARRARFRKCDVKIRYKGAKATTFNDLDVTFLCLC